MAAIRIARPTCTILRSVERQAEYLPATEHAMNVLKRNRMVNIRKRMFRLTKRGKKVLQMCRTRGLA